MIDIPTCKMCGLRAGACICQQRKRKGDTMIEKNKLQFNNEPVCPYCGNIERNAWELGLVGDGDEAEHVCGACEEEYLVVLNLSISYDTKEI